MTFFIDHNANEVSNYFFIYYIRSVNSKYLIKTSTIDHDEEIGPTIPRENDGQAKLGQNIDAERLLIG